MEWNKITKKIPNHKDLVLAKRDDGVIFPSIYYDNNSFEGFYPYTTFYSNTSINFYSEVITNVKFENIIEWIEITD